MTGMPPAMALGTNKLQAFGGALSASIYFLRKRAVNLSEFSFILLVIFIGSVIGTLLIQNLDASLIKKRASISHFSDRLILFIYA